MTIWHCPLVHELVSGLKHLPDLHHRRIYSRL